MAEPTKPTAAPPESREKAKKEAPAIVAANESAQEKLKKASKPEKQTQKKKEEPKKEEPVKKPTEEKKPEPTKPEKKEKNWRLVHGTLSVENNNWSARTETIGIGIENKTGTKQILVGPTITQERAPSGSTIEKVHPIGITGRINF